ncbi:MAG: hypothetical protein WC067_00765 [Candidatus Methanomethylophilaceae archaeon]
MKKKNDAAVFVVVIMILVASAVGVIHVIANNSANSGSIEGRWYCYTIEGYDPEGDYFSCEGNLEKEIMLWVDEDVDPNLFYGIYSSDEGTTNIAGAVVNGMVECQFSLADCNYTIRGQLNSRMDAVAIIVNIENSEGSQLYYCNYLKYGGRGVPILFKNAVISTGWVSQYSSAIDSDNEMSGVSAESLVITECKDKVFKGFMDQNDREVAVKAAFIYSSGVWRGLMVDDLGVLWYLRIDDNTMTVTSFDTDDVMATKCIFTSNGQEAVTYSAYCSGTWSTESITILSSDGKVITHGGTCDLLIRTPQNSDPVQNNNKLNLVSVTSQSDMQYNDGNGVGGILVYQGLMNIRLIVVNGDTTSKISGWFSSDGEKLYLYGIFVYKGEYYSESITMQKVH